MSKGHQAFNQLCKTCSGVFTDHWICTDDEEDGELTEYHKESLVECIQQSDGGNGMYHPNDIAVRHHSYLELEGCSASRNCHLCRAIWNSLQFTLAANPISHVQNQIETSQSIVEILRVEDTLLKDRNMKLAMSFWTPGLEDVLTFLDFGLYPFQPEPNSDFQYMVQGTVLTKLSQEASTSISGITTTNLKSWIEDCIYNHDECHSHEQIQIDNGLPTRLIQLGDTEAGDEIRVCHAEELPKSIQYTSLSHCWGSVGPSMRLTKATLPIYGNSLPLALIPQTFKDAFSITRSLGIQYIWIDALCIVQDSPEDWQEEAARMIAVYSNAYCTIAATSSKDADSGLIHDRDLINTLPCVIEATWSGLASGRYLVIPECEWDRCIEQKPINNRGWILQERLLSTRTVHMTDDLIFWECSHLRANEIFPNGLSMVHQSHEHRWTNRSISSFNHVFRLTLPTREPVTMEAVNRCWFDVVTAYSKCELTFGSDKLVALSGVAKIIHQISRIEGLDYFAGLWVLRDSLEDFCLTLLWHVEDTASRLEEYVAPSWSWASVTGGLTFRSISITDETKSALLVDIREGVVKRAAKDRFAMVESGHLIITGPLYRCQLYSEPQTRQKAANECPENPYVRLGTVAINNIRDCNLSLDDSEMCRHWPLEPGLVRYYFRFLQTGTPGYLINEGLLLARDPAGRGRFTRIGYLQIRDLEIRPEGTDDLFTDCSRVHKLEEEDYLETFEDGTCTIKLL